jgi:hypothetical protein
MSHTHIYIYINYELLNAIVITIPIFLDATYDYSFKKESYLLNILVQVVRTL